MVLWSLGEFCAQGLKDEDGALELGWIFARPKNEG